MNARVARPDSLPPVGDRFVVVEASAGTGKTFFLEHRVVDLILAGAELSQLLLVTFTDKAVAELRLRIRDLLDRLSRAEGTTDAACAWEIDDAARTRLRAAVTAFDQAPIFTIHGFCHRILLEDAFRANRLFQQTQVADEVAFDAAFGALLRERFALAAPDRDLLSAYLQWGKTVDSLRDLLLKCARTDARVPRHFDPERALIVMSALRREFTADACERMLREVNWKSSARYAPGWFASIHHALASATDEPASVLGACDALRKDGTTLVKYLGAKHASAAAALSSAIALMSLDEAIATDLLPHVMRRIGTDKAERGLFDYKDMLDLGHAALHGERGPEIADRLRTRMPWVMIDEFQDTDPVQWDIFRCVWMHESARGLTIVGDPKQAIYGFRGADVTTYLEARDELVQSGATQVTLSVNRRSTKPLVDAVNAILAGPPLSPMLDKAITYDTPVDASGDITCEGPRPPLTVFKLDGGGRDAQRHALAGAIGAEIERLRDAPPHWSKRGKDDAPFSLGHVMVLTRSNKESVMIAAALRALGLACALVESDRLFQTREAAELAAVLDAIAAPRDRSARLRALRTRFFDVPWADLAAVVDAPDHHPAIARLFDWAALAGQREYEVLFRRLVEDSRFAERALVLGGGERAHVNTWHLIELLLEEVARSRCDLGELVGRLRRWIHDHEELTDDRDVQRAETDADAIRILTIHKAKGLEAPYVFLFGCASGAPKSKVDVVRDTAGRTMWVAAHDETIKAQIQNEADGENQRLAYVALTRAQIRMYLPVYADKGLDKNAMYQPIQRCVGYMVQQAHALVEIVPVAVGADEDPPAPSDALATFDAPPPPAVAELEPIPAARAGLAVLSYTRLAREHAKATENAATPAAPAELDVAEVNADNVDETDAEDTEPKPGDLPGGANTGQFLHNVLEHADLATLRAAPTAEAWLAQPGVPALLAEHARAYAIDASLLPHAAQLVHVALAQPLQLTDGNTLPPLASATALAREVEFTYPVPGSTPPRALVKGFIDALVAYDDELWVLDYKSDRLAGADLTAAARTHVDEHYMVQARLYALAAARMRGARRLAGVLYAFVRHGIVVPLRIEPTTLGDWEMWLGNLPEGTQ